MGILSSRTLISANRWNTSGKPYSTLLDLLFFIFTTFYVLLQVMSAKKISSSNSVRPSIEETSNWQKPSLIYSGNDTMSKDDLIEAITLRLTRLEELEQENIILKRKLNRYFLNYFLFVTAVFRKPWMCHWVQLNYWGVRSIESKASGFQQAKIFATFIFHFVFFTLTRKGLLLWHRNYFISPFCSLITRREWHDSTSVIYKKKLSQERNAPGVNISARRRRYKLQF